MMQSAEKSIPLVTLACALMLAVGVACSADSSQNGGDTWSFDDTSTAEDSGTDGTDSRDGATDNAEPDIRRDCPAVERCPRYRIDLAVLRENGNQTGRFEGTVTIPSGETREVECPSDEPNSNYRCRPDDSEYNLRIRTGRKNRKPVEAVDVDLRSGDGSFKGEVTVSPYSRETGGQCPDTCKGSEGQVTLEASQTPDAFQSSTARVQCLPNGGRSLQVTLAKNRQGCSVETTPRIEISVPESAVNSGDSSGTISIGPSGESAGSARLCDGNGCQDADSGWIGVSTYAPGESAAGQWEVTVGEETYSGRFSARWCSSLDKECL